MQKNHSGSLGLDDRSDLVIVDLGGAEGVVDALLEEDDGQVEMIHVGQDGLALAALRLGHLLLVQVGE